MGLRRLRKGRFLPIFVTYRPTYMYVPKDFPRSLPLASLTGAHPKLAVVFRDGKYVQEYSEEERATRFEICDDLCEQLVVYSLRKMASKPEWTLEQYLGQLRAGLPRKGWGLTDAEMDWLVERLKIELMRAAK